MPALQRGLDRSPTWLPQWKHGKARFLARSGLRGGSCVVPNSSLRISKYMRGHQGGDTMHRLVLVNWVPWAKSVCVNHVVLAQCHLHLNLHCLSEELQERRCNPQSLKYLLSGPGQEKFATTYTPKPNAFHAKGYSLRWVPGNEGIEFSTSYFTDRRSEAYRKARGNLPGSRQQKD